ELTLPVLVSAAHEAWRYGHRTEPAAALAAAFWPGPLTLILRRTEATKPWQLGEEAGSIGIRVPGHPISQSLLRRTGGLAATSAEGLLRHRLAERGIQDISVESAGVSAWEESTATRDAVQALRELHIDISPHRARRLNRATIGSADLILGLSAEHHDAIVRLSS